MTANVANGRALRYAEGSARGLLHHHPGHCLSLPPALLIADPTAPQVVGWFGAFCL